MAKPRVTFLCSVCGNTQPQWMGKCPDCGAWDALEKFSVPPAEGASNRELAGVFSRAEGSGPATVAIPLPEIEPAAEARLSSGVSELDRVLGRGFVPGSVLQSGPSSM